DPYAALRSSYLQDRAGEIAALHGSRRHRGAKPANGDEFSQPLADPAAPGQPATPAAPPSRASELQDPLADPAAPAPSTAKPAEKPRAPAPELNDPLTDPAAK
ncbi:MAG: VacJ family lipoprotein, partial [Sphingomonadaceae bacterium]|nr:VacJ family lipoprotein [Sphingomonadaceae bacterium]